jgi:hypothetical protein
MDRRTQGPPSLTQFVDFGGVPGASVVASADVGAATKPATSEGLAALRKGLSLKEAEAILGPATSANEVQESSLPAMKRSCKRHGMKVEARFISDVLIDFTITPL